MSIHLNVSIKLRNESVKKSSDNRHKGLGGGRTDPAGIERDQSNGIMLSDDVTGVVHCIQTLRLRTNVTKRVEL